MPEAELVKVKEWSGKWTINEFYRPIAEALTSKFSKELGHIAVPGVLFIDDRESKAQPKGRRVYATCGKVPGIWVDVIKQMTNRWFTHYIVFYKKNTDQMSREQIISLVYHELRHIAPDGDLRPHSIEDFTEMIDKLGPNWASTKANIPDLLDESIINWDDIQGPPSLFPEQNRLQVVK